MTHGQSLRGRGFGWFFRATSHGFLLTQGASSCEVNTKANSSFFCIFICGCIDLHKREREKTQDHTALSLYNVFKAFLTDIMLNLYIPLR